MAARAAHISGRGRPAPPPPSPPRRPPSASPRTSCAPAHRPVHTAAVPLLSRKATDSPALKAGEDLRTHHAQHATCGQVRHRDRVESDGALRCGAAPTVAHCCASKVRSASHGSHGPRDRGGRQSPRDRAMSLAYRTSPTSRGQVESAARHGPFRGYGRNRGRKNRPVRDPLSPRGQASSPLRPSGIPSPEDWSRHVDRPRATSPSPTALRRAERPGKGTTWCCGWDAGGILPRRSHGVVDAKPQVQALRSSSSLCADRVRHTTVRRTPHAKHPRKTRFPRSKPFCLGMLGGAGGTRTHGRRIMSPLL